MRKNVLARPEFRNGTWRLCDNRPAWDGNSTWENLFVFLWEDEAERRALVIVNFSATPSQCYAAIPCPGLVGKNVRLRDLFHDVEYERHDIPTHGIYLDLAPWEYHVFNVAVAPPESGREGASGGTAGRSSRTPRSGTPSPPRASAPRRSSGATRR